MNNTDENEIDLIELFDNLWKSKLLISFVVFIAVAAASIYILFQKPTYESKINFWVETLPPYYVTDDKVLTEFQKIFYSQSIFNNWQKNQNNIGFDFSDLSKTEIVDSVLVTKNDSEQFLKFSSKRNKGDEFIIKGTFIQVFLGKSDQLTIINNLYGYTQYVNNVLKSEYILRAKNERNTIQTSIEALEKNKGNTGSLVDSFLAVDRYIAKAEKGDSVLFINAPTKPKKLSPAITRILITSFLIGGIIGVVIACARISLRKHKKI
ncbi:Wzz/FepE/Etk N-terminal domain-containing protein [Methylophilaceae bacterium]|nr:Wzz/FepE/Etk N-terminal domain-containing protein [Methylophilaceae bacterium]